MTFASICWRSRGCELPLGLEDALKRHSKPFDCYLCGIASFDCVPRKKSILETFNGGADAKCGRSKWVCVPCVWSMKARADERLKVGELSPGGKPKRAPWIRIFSILASDGPSGPKSLFFSKAEKRELREAILKLMDGNPSSWGLCLADSGQKQLAWRTPVNNHCGSGMIRFEEQLIRVHWARLWSLVDQINSLREVFTLDEITTGNYSIARVTKNAQSLELFEGGEEIIRPLRGGPFLQLAVWLSLPRKDNYDT